MNTLVVLFVLVVAVAFVLLKMKQSPVDDGLKFTKIEALFTPAERSFLGVLEQSLDDRYRVFGKVRLGDIVKTAKGLSPSRRTTANNKINQKHVDFVVCSASTLTVVGVVELDDKSHERDDRSVRDQFLDQALADAKIPVIHFSAKKGYAIAEVRSRLVECLAIETAPSVPSVARVVPEKPASVLNETAALVTDRPKVPPVTSIKSIVEATTLVCPKCESTMVKRQATKGPHAGKFFWACSAFPKCRQVVAVGEN
jgi:very-short-patch-repair endonuclease